MLTTVNWKMKTAMAKSVKLQSWPRECCLGLGPRIRRGSKKSLTETFTDLHRPPFPSAVCNALVLASSAASVLCVRASGLRDSGKTNSKRKMLMEAHTEEK